MKYLYKCAECGYTQEVTHGMNENPGVYCPNCYDPQLEPQRQPMEKVIEGGSGFHLKGKRWAKDGYGR